MMSARATADTETPDPPSVETVAETRLPTTGICLISSLYGIGRRKRLLFRQQTTNKTTSG